MSRLLAFVFVVATLGGGGCLRAQSNDNFANRLTLTGSAPIAVSNNLRASRETGEPNHAGAAAGRSLWYTWTAPTTGTVNLSTYYTGNGAPALRAVAVYTGNSVGSLAEVASSNNQAQAYYTSPYYYGYYYSTLFLGGTSVNASVSAGTVYQIAIDALSGYPYPPDDGTVFLAINAPPAILSAATATGTTGTSFSYAVLASGGATAYAASGLPAGLSLNATSGQITGVPASVGTYSVPLSATGPGGTGVGTLTLRITAPVPVVPVVPVITSSITARAYVGIAFSYSIYASGSPTAYTATNLPAGLSLNASTGVISGTATATGSTAVPISATGAAGTGTGTLTITADTPPLPIITSGLAASGTTGSSFYYYLYTNLDGYSGLAPTGYAAANLPPGVTLNSATANYLSGTPTQAGVYTVPISVTNAGGTRQAMVTITISDPVTTSPTPAAAAPVLAGRPFAFGVVGTAFSYSLAVSNAPTSFSAVSLPPGITFDSTAGVFAGTPTAAGTFPVPVTATNAYGTSTGTLTITISATAAAQSAAFGTPQTVIVSAASVAGYTGQTLGYSIVATYDGSSYNSNSSNTYWTFSATGLPPGLSVTGSSSIYGYGGISGTPTKTGVYQATISATCPAYTYLYGSVPAHPASTGTAVVTFIINAGPVPIAPVITGNATVSAVVGASVSYSPSATNSPTSYAASGLPAGLSISATAGTVSGTPTAAGTYQATISATNAAGTGTATVTFIVAALPAAPLITSSAAAAGTVGTSFSYSIYTGSTITGYGASALPPGLSVNTSTGVISGTPTQAGVYAVPVSATNAAGTASATLTLTISATAATRPPTITTYAVEQATVGQSFYGYIDTDVSATSYTVGGSLPPGLSYTAGNSYFSGTPTTPGTYRVPVSATNAAGTGTATLTIVVTNPGLPVFTSACALAGTVGQSFSSSVSASNSPTSYTFSSLPPGITQSSSSPGYLTGTPTQTGVYSVPVGATNAAGTTNATLTLTVSPAATVPLSAPVIGSSAGAMAYVGGPFTYAIQASNSPTSYTSSGVLPPGLAFNPSTGVLSGKPTTAGNYTVVFSATNSAGTGQASLSLAVFASTSAPPVVTSPAAIVAMQRQTFYYPITADSPVTSYSASNLPTGVSLNTTTGLLSGKLATTGTYSIPITVTGSAGQTQATVVITVLNPSFAVFTEPAVFSALTGQTCSGTVTTSASGSSSTSVSPLPGNLSLNASTGVISGIPVVAGTTAASVSQYTEYGFVYGKLLFSFSTAAPTVPVITSPAGVGIYAGMNLTFQLTATNSPTSFLASNLPPGLTLDTATGLISGNATTAGTYQVAVTGANAAGSSATATITFFIQGGNSAPAQVTSAVSALGAVGVPLSYKLGVNVASYYPQFTNLPPGLGYDGTSLTGTPTAAGIYTTGIYVIPYSSSGSPTNAAVTFNIAATSSAVPVVTSAAGASGSVNTAFSYTVAASNGPTAYTATNLPGGLTFNATSHTISGTPTTAGTYTISLGASSANGSGYGTLTLAIAAPTVLAPTLTSTYNTLERAFTVGATSSTDSVWYINATNSPTSYAASNLPPGLSLNTTTGQFTGTLTTTGTYPVTVSATNSTGTASAIITYVVSASTLSSPVIAYLDAGLTGFVGAQISTVYLSATNSPTSYAASNLPPGLVLNTLSGQISGTPTTAGTYTVNLSATNGTGTGTAVWQVVVKDDSLLYPVFDSISAETGSAVGQSIYYSFYAYTYYGGTNTSAPATITVSGLPTGVQVSSSSANSLSLSGTPTTAGTYPVTLTATALGGATTTVTWTLVVTPAPAPTITSAAGAVGNLQNGFSYTLYASNTVTSYNAGTLPSGLVLNPTTGQISGIPTGTGTTVVPVSATGPYGTASAVVTIRIDPMLYGGLPVITSAATISSQEIPSSYPYGYYPYNTGTTVSYSLTGLNQPTNWTATNLPVGLSLNPYSGLISGQPVGAGVFQVPVSATNASGTVNAMLTVVCNALLAMPSTPLAVSTYVGASYAGQIAAYYPANGSVGSSAAIYGYDGSTISAVTYAAAGLPPGLTINSYTGQISGTPTLAGTYPVALTTTNRAGTGRAVSTIFVASAAPPSTPGTPVLPVFSANAQAAGYVGIPLKYSLSASGAPGYAATGLPAGITLNPSTGLISGTPAAPGVWTVAVSATNAAGTSTGTLTLTIESIPATPNWSNVCAATANIGASFGYFISTSNYTGEPSATSYAAGALPAGLTFNAASGYLSGTPTGPAGTYTVPLAVAVGPSLTVNGVLTLSVQTAPAPTTPLMTSPAGALGVIGNPFYYAVSNSAFAPTTALPAGLTYNPTTGVISGYPTAVGTYVIPMAVGGGSSGGSVASHSAKRPGSTLVRPTGRRTSLTTAGSSDTPTAVLTIQVINPSFSLPRLTTQPSGGSVMENGTFDFVVSAVGVPTPVFQWSHNGVPLDGATDFTLEIDALQTQDSGIYTVTASNAAGSVTSNAVTLVVQTTYTRWQSAHFTAQEIAAGSANDNASFSGDGVPNLLKYALDLDPRAVLNQPLPVASSRSTVDGRLQLEFDRDAGLTDINYLVEASTDLSAWTIIAQSVAGAPLTGLTGSEYITETVVAGSNQRDVTVKAAPSSGDRQFLRMRVVRP